MVEDLIEMKKMYLRKMTRNSFVVGLVMLLLFLLSLSIVLGNESIQADGDNFIPVVIFGVGFITSLVFALIFKLKTTKNIVIEVRKFCNETEHPDDTLNSLEKAWQEGIDYQYGKMGKEYIIFLIKGSVFIISLNQVIWMYGIVHSMNLIRYNVSLHIKNLERKDQTLSLAWFSKKRLNEILSFVFANTTHIVIGTNNQIDQIIYRKDLKGMMQYAQEQRKHSLEVEK